LLRNLPQPRAEERIARAATKSVLKKQLKAQKETAGANTEPSKTKKSKGKGKSAAADSDSEGEADDQTQEEGEDDGAAEYFEKIIDARGSGIRGGEASATEQAGQVLFSQLSLSRPLLRAVERTGYVSATPIQAQTIPYALAGKDICASAETGSGKTAGRRPRLLFVLCHTDRACSLCNSLRASLPGATVVPAEGRGLHPRTGDHTYKRAGAADPHGAGAPLPVHGRDQLPDLRRQEGRALTGSHPAAAPRRRGEYPMLGHCGLC
jgi:hypothetical protein